MVKNPRTILLYKDIINHFPFFRLPIILRVLAQRFWVLSEHVKTRIWYVSNSCCQALENNFRPFLHKKTAKILSVYAAGFVH